LFNGLDLHFFWLSNRNEGPLELRPQPPEARGSGGGGKGVWGQIPSVWQFLECYYKPNAFLGIFELKFSLKILGNLLFIIICPKLKSLKIRI